MATLTAPASVTIATPHNLSSLSLTLPAAQVCERGCLLVNGICPISDAEWKQALKEKEAKAQRVNTADVHLPQPGAADAVAERHRWQHRAVLLSVFTIVYCIAEGVAGIVLGSKNVSISLLALGADSWIEVVSASLVCWRFYADLRQGLEPAASTISTTSSTRKERVATFTIGILLCLLAGAIVGGSIAALVTDEAPESDLPNVIIGAVGVVALTSLFLLKTRVAIALQSSTVEADAQCSLFCVWLSLVLLVGAVVFREASSLWWFDSATAIVLALLIAKEGHGTVKASLKKDFSGAGCGCEGEKDGWAMRWMRQRINAAQPGTETALTGIEGCEVGCSKGVEKASCCGKKDARCEKDACGESKETAAAQEDDVCCGKGPAAKCDAKDAHCSTAPRSAKMEEACCGKEQAATCSAQEACSSSSAPRSAETETEDACCAKQQAAACGAKDACCSGIATTSAKIRGHLLRQEEDELRWRAVQREDRGCVSAYRKLQQMSVSLANVAPHARRPPRPPQRRVDDR